MEEQLIQANLELKQLKASVDGLRSEINRLTSIITMDQQKIMKAKDVEELYGLAKGSCYTYNRIYLPNFGVRKGISKHALSWTKEEVLTWNSRSVEDRQREYDMLA